MSIEFTKNSPDLDEKIAEVTYEFELNGHPIEIVARTGMKNRPDESPNSLVVFDGKVFKSSGSDEVIAEHTDYHRENILRDNRPPIYGKLISILGAEKPTSVEALFYKFMTGLGEEAGWNISKTEVQPAFEEIANTLIEQDGFSEQKGEGNWKPYSRVWEDRQWLNSIQN